METLWHLILRERQASHAMFCFRKTGPEGGGIVPVDLANRAEVEDEVGPGPADALKASGLVEMALSPLVIDELVVPFSISGLGSELLRTAWTAGKKTMIWCRQSKGTGGQSEVALAVGYVDSQGATS